MVSPALPDARRIFERHMAEHPLIRYPELDGRAVTFSDFYSRPRFHDLGLYQEFFRQLSLEHQLAIKVPALAPLLIVLCLNRSGGCDFSGRDRALMNLLRPHLVQAYRTAEVFTELRRGVALLERGPDGLRRGLVVVTGDGRLGFATDRAQRWLDRYFGGRRSGPDRLPRPSSPGSAARRRGGARRTIPRDRARRWSSRARTATWSSGSPRDRGGACSCAWSTPRGLDRARSKRSASAAGRRKCWRGSPRGRPTRRSR